MERRLQTRRIPTPSRWRRLIVSRTGRGLLFALLWLGGITPPARGADLEARDYNAAVKAFQDGFAERAERELADFVTKYPASLRVPDAILFQARAAFARTNLNRALTLLSTNLPRAGALADEYRFWLGQMRLESGDAAEAAREFASLLREFTNSTRRLEAAYGEAQARFQLGQWERVVELLRNPAGVFQQAARAGRNDELVARGQLLLAEALFRRRDFPAAEAVVRGLTARGVEIDWARQFLLCRLLLATGRTAAAFEGATNLLAIAAAANRPALQAESLLLQGAICEEMNRHEDALATYEKLQADAMPEEPRRLAFLRIVERALARNDLATAVARLEKFLAAHPQDAASDVVLLTLGELRLREHFLSASATNAPLTNAPPVPATNRLQQAIVHFDQLAQKHPLSPHLGRAYLNRGWALLADEKVLEAQAAFQLAADKLPFGDDQAVGRFKLADTQFLLGDLTNALTNYRKLIADYAALPRGRSELLDRAWHQIARACARMGDLAGANEALRRILADFPASLYAPPSGLLLGQQLNLVGRHAEARALLTELIRRFPDTELVPQMHLAIARSYELETNWPAALQAYEALLARFPTNAVAPRAEFLRALACERAGRQTNAFQLMTNFLARFPTHDLAPHAQDWIGDFHYRAEDFAEAERNYQRLYQNTNWPPGELTFRARLKAGRAALMRQGYDDAITYFVSLINDKRCPDDLVAETFFAYGDTLILKPTGPATTNLVAKFDTAIDTFQKIPQLYPASPLVPRALGRIADCHFQLAAQDPRRYDTAAEFYQKALASPRADLATRSQAQVGLGNVLVKQAQLKSSPDLALLDTALNHYLDVVYGKNLHADEVPLPFWVKEAGLAAARLLESQRRWSNAIELYSRLQQMLPALRPGLEKRIAAAREMAAKPE